jgi:hypothetical protein
MNTIYFDTENIFSSKRISEISENKKVEKVDKILNSIFVNKISSSKELSEK